MKWDVVLATLILIALIAMWVPALLWLWGHSTLGGF